MVIKVEKGESDWPSDFRVARGNHVDRARIRRPTDALVFAMCIQPSLTQYYAVQHFSIGVFLRLGICRLNSAAIMLQLISTETSTMEAIIIIKSSINRMVSIEF